VQRDKCADGVRVADRLAHTEISYGPDTITITLTAQITFGGHTCAGPLPPDQVKVHLKEPVGDRKLVDGNAGG
jgi:hypothetical protein